MKSTRIRRWFWWAALAAGALGGCAAPDGASLYASVSRASAIVLVDGRVKGAAFFVEGDGLLVTAAHVVKGGRDAVEVVLPTGGRLKARRIAEDFGSDLALLRVPRQAGAYPTLAIADNVPAPGGCVFLYARPIFQDSMLLAGSVASAAPTYCYNPGTGCYVRSFYVMGPSPKGASGGGWVDVGGRVVGVQSGYLLSADSPAGVAFACLPGAIRELLRAKRSVKTPILGTRLDELWNQPEGFIARFPKGTEGVVTNLPEKDGPVAKAGLTKESLITAIDGRCVRHLDGLLDVVRAKRPGDHVTLTVLDPDRKQPRQVDVCLGEAGD